MWLGSVVPARNAGEQGRIAAFFRALDTPIFASEVHGRNGESSQIALAAATIAVGALLAVSGIFAAAMQARLVDGVLGLSMVGLGAKFLLLAKRRRAAEVPL